MNDFETEADYGLLPSMPVLRGYAYLIPKVRHDAEKAALATLRAENERLWRLIRNWLSFEDDGFDAHCNCGRCKAVKALRAALKADECSA